MKTTIFSITFLLLSFTGFAQSDAKAKKILDDLSAKTKVYKSINASFSYTLENQADDIKETQEGSLITKGEKYRLSIAGQLIICDGKSIWTYLPDAEEVQITSVPTAAEKEEEDYISPTSIFTLYEKGFKHQFVKEETLDGVNVQLINLFPTQPDKKAYHTIKLYINTAKQEIHRIQIMSKDGTVYTYQIKSFKANAEAPDSQFVFNKSAHPDVEVIDLRETE
jgi:outer membrane lipoprotein-sorting protein